MKKALITGITGQDGSYLAEFLLAKGYQVHGLLRYSRDRKLEHIHHLLEDKHLYLHTGDLADTLFLVQLLKNIQPDEVYNLGAQSHVHKSFDFPEYTTDVDAMGVLRLLEGIRIADLTRQTKFYQAGTSELFGKVSQSPQDEDTPFHPYSPYAIAKQYAYWIVKEYREAYGLFAVNGILFNHESERRGEDFVTRKITRAAGRIAEGLQEVLELGNLDAKRDWGYAPDFVRCMWLMLQQEQPEDFVIATGQQHSVRDFVTKAFEANGIDIVWSGKGVDECARDAWTGQVCVRVNPDFFRPTEVESLLGNPNKAISLLGWNPSQTPFAHLVEKMVDHDRKLAIKERKRKEVGN